MKLKPITIFALIAIALLLSMAVSAGNYESGNTKYTGAIAAITVSFFALVAMFVINHIRSKPIIIHNYEYCPMHTFFEFSDLSRLKVAEAVKMGRIASYTADNGITYLRTADVDGMADELVME